jgi:hypothetical protein
MLSPPIGQQLMMDFFTDPEGIAKDAAFVVNQLPKWTEGEVKTQLSELTEMWGIQFKEGWHWPKVLWILAVGFALPSLLFGTLWALLKNDIQGGFGIATWWLTGATILVGLIGTYS